MKIVVFSAKEGSADDNASCSENSSSTRTLGSPSVPNQTATVQFFEPTDGLKCATPPGPSTTGPGQACTREQAQAKRRLELEVGDPQDGGKTPKARKPVASQSHTGEQTPAPNPTKYTSAVERSRYDTSLTFLTRRFAELVNHSTDGVFDLNLIALQLNAPKRRVYDVTNVLEGIKLIKKKSKNNIEWLGGPVTVEQTQELCPLIEAEKKLDELIQSCTRQIYQICEDQRYAYLTYEDIQRIPSLKEQTVIVIKAPAETKLEVPHPEESLQVHLRSTQGPIEVLICSDDPSPTGASVANGGHLNLSANGKDSVPVSPYSSFVRASSKDDANNTSGFNSVCNPLSNPTQHSSPVTVAPVSPMHTSLTSLQPPSEDQQSFVALSSPLAFSFDGEQYLVSLAEDEGITDLFSSVDLEQLSVDMPPV
ncbi:transcription factor E2F3 isoform X2 [Scophthalmus maximus]|uniref:transcription factor E2F3 isoform X2 n=1 Tax=Scophthalmus maximus TaxID=52904 RepID=UPI0015E0F71F|nr:transcription factor E2F3 isoform X2 [Scophthalmus maximus]